MHGMMDYVYLDPDNKGISSFVASKFAVASFPCAFDTASQKQL